MPAFMPCARASSVLPKQAVHAFKDGIVINAAAKKLKIPNWSFIEN
jgi:hypothetical protein